MHVTEDGDKNDTFDRVSTAFCVHKSSNISTKLSTIICDVVHGMPVSFFPSLEYV